MRLRKGREIMKKIIAVVSALVLIGCVAVVFYGCGAEDKEMTTPTITTTSATDNITATDNNSNDGVVTDQSNDDNGVIGDMVTDVSEGISEVMTDMSEDVSRMMD